MRWARGKERGLNPKDKVEKRPSRPQTGEHHTGTKVGDLFFHDLFSVVKTESVVDTIKSYTIVSLVLFRGLLLSVTRFSHVFTINTWPGLY